MLIAGIEVGVLKGVIQAGFVGRGSRSIPANDIALRRSSRGDLDAFLAQRFPAAPGVTWRDDSIEGPEGQIRMRTYTPRDVNPNNAILYYIHGGGLIFSSIETYDARCSHWASRSNSTVISIDYRLSPEHPYPGPLDDCMAGLRWVAEHKSQGEKVIVVGDSAGGGLAAAVALRNRDEDMCQLSAQVLVYPMLDDRNLIPQQGLTGPLMAWSYGDNALGWNSYLEGNAGAPVLPEYASPARAIDLRGLPPTYIDTGTKDIFLAEDIIYAQRLLAAEVPTKAHVWNGALHGFDYFAPNSRLARRAWNERFDFLERINQDRDLLGH